MVQHFGRGQLHQTVPFMKTMLVPGRCARFCAKNNIITLKTFLDIAATKTLDEVYVAHLHRPLPALALHQSHYIWHMDSTGT